MNRTWGICYACCCLLGLGKHILFTMNCCSMSLRKDRKLIAWRRSAEPASRETPLLNMHSILLLHSRRRCSPQYVWNLA